MSMSGWDFLDVIGYPETIFPDCVEREIYRPDEETIKIDDLEDFAFDDTVSNQ